MKRLVAKFPIVTSILLESANLSQLIRMWTERSALGQSVIGWSLVLAALILWLVYYIVMVPDQIILRYTQAFGILMNLSVVLTVIYFRHLGQ